ncbi:hypothetical protein [Streptomyces sp. NPDC050738]|uniref:hypothetical protein n=1 Tax=Streptomyces sp. NPDC050738 TaxID=3154744 RepID=UPI00342238C5
MGVALIVPAVVCAVLSFLALTVWVPGQQDRYEHYQAAGPCPARATAQERAAKDCLSTWYFTVTKVTIKHAGKASHYTARLEDPDDASWHSTVDFGDPGPLLDTLHRDDTVTATVWRRDIVVLSKDGVRQNTSDAPRDELQFGTSLGVLAALLAAQLLVFGAARLVRPAAYAPFVWDPYGKWLAWTDLCAGLSVGLASVWLGIPWWTVFVTVPAAVTGVMALLVRYERSRRQLASGIAPRKTPRPA